MFKQSGKFAILVVIACAIPAFSFHEFSPRTAAISCLLAWTMIIIAIVDARRLLIPDVLSLPAIPAGLLASGELLDSFSSGLVNLDNVIGAVVGGISLWLLRAAYFSVRHREGLGLGDVKLASVAGAWTGWQGLSLVLLLASALALTLITAITLWRRTSLPATAKVPFGTFLAPSIWFVWVLDAYGHGL